jgi:hypothetical protein
MSVSTPKKHRPELSICVTVKNRSLVYAAGRVLALFPNCVGSIIASVPRELSCELVVADWQSDDWPLVEWMPEVVGTNPTTIVTMSGEFSRGRGRNAAAQAANSDQLFFLDADCLISEFLLQRTAEVLASGSAYFPILYSYSDPQHLTGWWRHKGFGNCMISRDAFELAGRFPEYDYWGREDVDFFDSVAAIQEIVREEIEGFYHQWHPNDFEWKNRYGRPSPHEELKKIEEQHLAVAATEIERTVSADEPLILIDDAQLKGRLPRGLRLLPFLERNGEYCGLPADSASAISDMERLRAAGAARIVFVWTTFWWLDYYAEFREYLDSRYRRLVDNERLIVFDLKYE